jgi:NAD(P)H-nitrite reductase large subunit
MFSIGCVQPEDASFDLVEGDFEGNYSGFLFRDGRLTGAILLGDTRASSAVKSAIEKRQDLSALLRSRPNARQVLDWFVAAM